ncbi:MAG: carbamoyltransferase [Bacteroidia bacterium]
MIILGISAWFHDAAAAIIINGKIVAAAEEERFTRKKHDERFPSEAIRFCLDYAHISLSDVDFVAFYEKPFLKFERILESYYETAPYGIRSFVTAMPNWFGEKLFAKSRIHKALKKIDDQYEKTTPLLFPEHHLSHAASAYYPSTWDDAAILTIDGVGEWTCTSIAHGKGSDITVIKESHFPDSLGLLYSAFTQFLGFRVNSGEYKLMGLSAYGEPQHADTQRFKQLILEQIVTVHPDGSIALNMPMFGFRRSLSTIKKAKWETLFGMKVRTKGEAFTLRHAHLACAIQLVCEEAVIKLATEAKRLTGANRLCMAGGVSLNCVANGRLLRSGIFDEIYIQPAAGDSGGALGAALAAHHIHQEGARDNQRRMPFLGPAILEDDINDLISEFELDVKPTDESSLYTEVAHALAEGQVVAWCQDRMEFGPRALGNRSILGDPQQIDMQKRVNLQVKKRESYRPFAPAILAEEAHRYFDLIDESPHMLMVYPIKEAWRKTTPEALAGMSVVEKLAKDKSSFPAITHADFSSRIQTVSAENNAAFHQLLGAFFKQTNCPILLNTSFNERGEPMVATAKDAFMAFMRIGIDVLVLNKHIIHRSHVSHLDEKDFERQFELD